MSFIRYATLYSFRKLNPDWQIDLYVVQDNGLKKTWTGGQQQDFFAYTKADYFDRVESLGVNIIPWKIRDTEGVSWSDRVTISQQSNFCKWQILGREGGLYLDMDILWTQPIEEYYQSVKYYDIAICGSPYLSIGFLGSSPNCAFFQDAWRHAFEGFYPERYQTAGVENLYRMLGNPVWWELPGSPVEAIQQMYPQLKVYNNPFELVYPWPHDRMEEVWQETHKELPDGCIGIHWYAGAGISQQFNNLIQEGTTIENTFTYWLGRLK